MHRNLATMQQSCSLYKSVNKFQCPCGLARLSYVGELAHNVLCITFCMLMGFSVWDIGGMMWEHVNRLVFVTVNAWIIVLTETESQQWTTQAISGRQGRRRKKKSPCPAIYEFNKENCPNSFWVTEISNAIFVFQTTISLSAVVTHYWMKRQWIDMKKMKQVVWKLS